MPSWLRPLPLSCRAGFAGFSLELAGSFGAASEVSVHNCYYYYYYHYHYHYHYYYYYCYCYYYYYYYFIPIAAGNGSALHRCL